MPILLEQRALCQSYIEKLAREQGFLELLQKTATWGSWNPAEAICTPVSGGQSRNSRIYKT